MSLDALVEYLLLSPAKYPHLHTHALEVGYWPGNHQVAIDANRSQPLPEPALYPHQTPICTLPIE